MNAMGSPSDIIIVNRDRAIFRSGFGRLTKHSKVSATLAQVLTLFSAKIMKGERIHFIRFDKHRMLLLPSQRPEYPSLVAIVLVPIETSARQVIPSMKIALTLIEEFLDGKIEDVQIPQLDCFYRVLNFPSQSVVILPKTAEGIRAALVLLTAFAHDLHLSIESISKRMYFVREGDYLSIENIIHQTDNLGVLSFVKLPDHLKNPPNNFCEVGQIEPLRQFFSSIPKEAPFETLARLFSQQSNAYKMHNFLKNNDALEISQSIALLDKEHEDYIRKDILLATVLNPGRDILVTLSTPLMMKLREIARHRESIGTASQEPISEPLIQSDTLYQSNDGIIKSDHVISDEEMILPKELPVDEEILLRINRAKERGSEYKFKGLPLVLDTSPNAVGSPEIINMPLEYSTKDIKIQVLPTIDRSARIHVFVVPERLEPFKAFTEDLVMRNNSEVFIDGNHVVILTDVDNLRSIIRSLLWLGVVEYLSQVQLGLQERSKIFDISMEGSILIIPPKRDYVKGKIPTKFKTFIEEELVFKEYEEEALWTIGVYVDSLTQRLITPLHSGEGVVFISRDLNQEMEEIALFLLLISEVCGVGFSRW